MSANILGFSGSIGSGKSTISTELSTVLNYRYASFGNFVRKIATKMGYMAASRTQLQEVGEMLVGNDARSFCQSVLNDAEWIQGEGLVIDGIRHLHILEILCEICVPQKLLLIYVAVDENIRRERVMGRGTDSESALLTKHSTELQVNEVLRLRADLIVDGSKTVENNMQLMSQWLRTKD
jgi:dephospho-CoA kinase